MYVHILHDLFFKRSEESAVPGVLIVGRPHTHTDSLEITFPPAGRTDSTTFSWQENHPSLGLFDKDPLPNQLQSSET